MANSRLFGSVSVYAGIGIILTILSFERSLSVQAVTVDSINRVESGEIPDELTVAAHKIREESGRLNEAGPLFSQPIISKEQQIKKDLAKTHSGKLHPGNQRERRTAGCRGDTCEEPRRNRGGTVYTRWGKDDCPDSASQLVYAGVVGGPSCSQKGGGGGYLCLPEQPDLDDNIRQHRRTGWNRAKITNGTYKTQDFSPFSGLNTRDVPCAVCMVEQRSIQIMYPAKNECPSGWTKEYHGYLMSAPNYSYRSDWICVDGGAEEKPAVSGQRWGAALVPVEASCRSSSNCGSYRENSELKCVVCTR